MDLILVGPQGSGKGTQGKLLAEKYGYKIFETGHFVREMSKQDDELGRKIKKISESGNLVPNEVIMEIVEKFCENTPTDVKIIFDGIPRSLEQKKTLDEVLKKQNRNYKVLYLSLNEETSIKRLLKRSETEGRSDDNIEAIKTRLNNFITHTQPLLEIWKNDDLLLEVNGELSINEGFVEMEKALKLES